MSNLKIGHKCGFELNTVMANLKESILKLRDEGKTYDEIQTILGCSKGSISYHCSETVRLYYRLRRRKNRRSFLTKVKMAFGGKCLNCGYSKCLDALQFHHIDPESKIKYKNKKGAQLSIGQIANNINQKLALDEIKKSILLCANCHREVESGISDITNLVNQRLSNSDYVEVL